MAGSVSDFDFHDGEDNAGTAEASDEGEIILLFAI